MSLLSIRGLDVSFAAGKQVVHAVNGLSLDVAASETLGIVGESGSGKSLTALAIMGLLPPNARVSGSIQFDGTELLTAAPDVINRLRGARIGMIFQDPMTCLNPYLSVGLQMAEVLEQHQGMSRASALAECARMLSAVHLSDAAARLQRYPHELSGGQRQRVMIAMSLLCHPQLLIADEPTTALDVTVQAQILQLLTDLRRDFQLAMILISHDLGIVSELADRTLVMYAGQAMEMAPTATLIRNPQHPYSRALLDSRPMLHGPRLDELRAIPGQVPSIHALPQGCAFEPRCSRRMTVCADQRPQFFQVGPQGSACHLVNKQ